MGDHDGVAHAVDSGAFSEQAAVSDFNQCETDHDRLVDLFCGRWSQSTKALHKASLVNRANLIQQHNRVHTQATLSRFDKNARGSMAADVRGDRRHDRHRTVLIADVVLQN